LEAKSLATKDQHDERGDNLIALISIDYTYDFVADKGTLTVGKPAQAIEQKMLQITKDFYNNGNLIVYAIDKHQKLDFYHPESNLFPEHNIEGEPGRKLYGLYQKQYEELKASNQVMYLDKTRYSAFCGTTLDMELRARNIKEIHLIGVCTDICVLHTAIDAYNLGYEIVVYEGAVASFNETGHKWALEHMTNCLGGKVIA